MEEGTEPVKLSRIRPAKQNVNRHDWWVMQPTDRQWRALCTCGWGGEARGLERTALADGTDHAQA